MKTRIEALRANLQASMDMDAAKLRRYMDRYIRTFDDDAILIEKYYYQTEAQQAFYREFLADPLADVAAFHKLVMLDFIEDFPNRVKKIKIPASIHDMFEIEFNRILNAIAGDSAYVFDWSSDVFAKDFGICTFRVIPAGAQLMELSGVPVSWLFRRGARYLRSLWFLLFEMKGTRPMLEIHTHAANLTDFNPDGWNRCYVRIGEYLQMNPGIKGMQGSSWFYDPALAQVSPRLSYLREVPCSNGAEIFFVEEEGPKSSAFATSKSRQDLYAAGKYTPAAYLLVWPRNALMAYAESNAALLSERA